MDFRESYQYLLSLGNEVSAMKLGLENIRMLLAALGNPQANYRKVQVAGTNGKGSVCAFLDSICNSAGIRTGLYTSPHLVSITERIRINGAEISEKEFARLATLVRDTSESLVKGGKLESVPTFFEQVTAIALLAFADAGVELAILETGLGGRLDATTAANAEIAAITQIALDHQKYLGDAIEEIAAEKAAVIHEGSKVVIGGQNEAALVVIKGTAANFGIAPKYASDVEAIVLSKEAGGDATVRERAQHEVDFTTEKASYRDVQLGLLGRHQIENAKIAILLAELLQERFPIGTVDIVRGLENARHPGRLEFHGNFLFDGAHNPAGAIALRDFVEEFIDSPVTMIFGSMSDKDISEIGSILFPLAETLILTTPENSRAMPANELARMVPANVESERVVITENVGQAIERASDFAGSDGLILITGSLYLIGAAQKLLFAKQNSSAFDLKQST